MAEPLCEVVVDAESGNTPARCRRGNGQVVVIFAGAMFVMTLMMAVVIDLSWLWSSALKIQRAADAAALAGAVTLPDDSARGYVLARKEAAKNGYVNGTGGVVVSPTWDGQVNPYRMNVAIRVPVGMFFMRVLGITSFDVTRTAHAEFNLPMKMGSPQNYYGVGFYEGLTGGAIETHGPNPPDAADTSAPSNDFASRDEAFDSDDDYATGDVGQGTSGDTQAYGDFGFNVPVANTVRGIEVRLEAHASDPAGCKLAVEVSDGTSLSGTGKRIDLTDSDPPGPADTWPLLGGPTDRWGLTWAPGELADGRFKVRLRALDLEPADDPTNTDPDVCNNTATVSVDALIVTVYSRTPRVSTPLPVPHPTISGGSVPDEDIHNVWGAIITSGGFRENGDRYAPSYLGNGAGGGEADPNPNYDSDGYDYTVEIGGGATNGEVRLFDPIFCATGPNTTGGYYGAGDHWTDHPGDTVIAPVAVTFRLFDMQSTPLDVSDDGAPLSTMSLTPPPGKTLGDFSDDFGTPANSGDLDAVDCSTDPRHNEWVLLASNLGPGMYRVNVNTTMNAGNINVGAENLFSIHVAATGGIARVYGAARMAAYTNMDAATSRFYLTQIEAVHAGKTILLKLFDPGECTGCNGFVRIKSPDNNTYSDVSFTWTADNGQSGSGTQIKTSDATAGPLFNNRLVTITIPLPEDYGSAGLTPPTESEPGWWKIEYEMSAANDTTTWEVGILENPVHLVVE